MVKVNGKELNREQFKEYVQLAKLTAERRKKIEARKNRKSTLKSKSSIWKNGAEIPPRNPPIN